MPEITSPQNARIKAAARLRRGQHRRSQGRTLIDGVREISCALHAGVRLTEVFACPSLCRDAQAGQLVDQLHAGGVKVWCVTERVFQKLAFGERDEGVVAVAEAPRTTLDEIQLPDNPLVAVLEGVEKPGNLGAVVRSADAAGVSAVVVADGRTDLFNPAAIRASLGTIFAVPVAATSATETLAWLLRHRVAIYATRVDGDVVYTDVDFRQPAAVVLGSEAEGLSPVWSAAGVTAVRLPMRGMADSLNLSVAAAVVFYEAMRQRAEAV